MGTVADHNIAMGLHKRIETVEAALKVALTAMSVASAINAVRAEYDFEPAIQQAHKALLPNK